MEYILCSDCGLILSSSFREQEKESHSSSLSPSMLAIVSASLHLFYTQAREVKEEEEEVEEFRPVCLSFVPFNTAFIFPLQDFNIRIVLSTCERERVSDILLVISNTYMYYK